MSTKPKETLPVSIIRYELLTEKEITPVVGGLIIKYVRKLPAYSDVTRNIKSRRFLSIYMATKYASLYHNGIKITQCNENYYINDNEKVQYKIQQLVHDLRYLDTSLRSCVKKIKLAIREGGRYIHSHCILVSDLILLSVYFDNYEAFVCSIKDDWNLDILLLTIDIGRDNMFKYLFDSYTKKGYERDYKYLCLNQKLKSKQDVLRKIFLYFVASNKERKVVLLPTFKRLGYLDGTQDNNPILRLMFKDEFFKQLVSLDIYEYVVDLYYDKDTGPGYKKWQKEMADQYTQIEKVILEPKIC